MVWIASAALTNAITATLLAIAVWALSRLVQRPALTHVLWSVVLLKLLTPPLVEIPLGWNLNLISPFQQHEVLDNAAVDNALVAASPVEKSPDVAAAGASYSPMLQSDVAGNEPVQGEWQPKTAQRSQVHRRAAEPGPIRPRAARSAAGMGPPAFLRWLVLSLPAVWIAGMVVSLLFLARRAWKFRSFVRCAGRADPVLQRRVQSLAITAGLDSSPAAIVTGGVVSPMLWGIRRRITLIFPAQLFKNLPAAACDTLLLHELAHFARGDQWVRLLELLVSIIYWWHPVVWWARREIEAAEEQCCDAWVIKAQTGSRRTYAEALLATIDFLYEEPVILPPVASGLGGADLLRVRLTQIMRGELPTELSQRAKWAVLGSAMFILPLGPGLFAAANRSLPKVLASVNEVRSIAAESVDLHPANATPETSEPSSPSTSSLIPTVHSALNMRPAPVVTATAMSPNGKYRLERRKGSQVMLVNEFSTWRLDLSTHAILCVAFTPDSRQFLTGHNDGIVRIWDSETGGLVSSLKGGSDALWSIAVATTAVGRYCVAAGSKDGSVFVSDLASGDELARLPPSESSVSCLRWSPGGERLAISFGEFSNHEENRLLVWSPFDYKVLAQQLLMDPIAALAWLPDQAGLLMADWQGETSVWQSGSEGTFPIGSLGEAGKQRAEAANWSANCPLIGAPITAQMPSGAE